MSTKTVSSPPQADPEWIGRLDAARLLEVEPHVITRLAGLGRIGVRELPIRNKFRRADVERLAKSVRQASK